MAPKIDVITNTVRNTSNATSHLLMGADSKSAHLPQSPE